jgi:hypothetical protein
MTALEHFFLGDPPYVQDTRICGRYSYEMTQGDHEDTRSRRLEQIWISPTALGRKPSVADRRRGAAYRTHLARIKSTEAALMEAIRRLRQKDERVTISGVASTVGICREHVSKGIGTSSPCEVWWQESALPRGPYFTLFHDKNVGSA